MEKGSTSGVWVMDAVRWTVSMFLAVFIFSAAAVAGEGKGGGGAAGFEGVPLPTGLSKDTWFIIYYIDKRFEAIDKRFEQIDKRFAQMQHEMDKRFDEVDKRFEMIIDLMTAIVGAFAAIVAVAIGFAIWDRRTMTRPFEDKIKKLEQDTDKLRRLIDALKKLAKQDPKLAEVLRSFSLM